MKFVLRRAEVTFPFPRASYRLRDSALEPQSLPHVRVIKDLGAGPRVWKGTEVAAVRLGWLAVAGLPQHMKHGPNPTMKRTARLLLLFMPVTLTLKVGATSIGVASTSVSPCPLTAASEMTLNPQKVGTRRESSLNWKRVRQLISKYLS